MILQSGVANRLWVDLVLDKFLWRWIFLTDSNPMVSVHMKILFGVTFSIRIQTGRSYPSWTPLKTTQMLLKYLPPPRSLTARPWKNDGWKTIRLPYWVWVTFPGVSTVKLQGSVSPLFHGPGHWIPSCGNVHIHLGDHQIIGDSEILPRILPFATPRDFGIRPSSEKKKNQAIFGRQDVCGERSGLERSAGRDLEPPNGTHVPTDRPVWRDFLTKFFNRQESPKDPDPMEGCVPEPVPDALATCKA